MNYFFVVHYYFESNYKNFSYNSKFVHLMGYFIQIDFLMKGNFINNPTIKFTQKFVYLVHFIFFHMTKYCFFLSYVFEILLFLIFFFLLYHLHYSYVSYFTQSVLNLRSYASYFTYQSSHNFIYYSLPYNCVFLCLNYDFYYFQYFLSLIFLILIISSQIPF